MIPGRSSVPAGAEKCGVGAYGKARCGRDRGGPEKCGVGAYGKARGGRDRIASRSFVVTLICQWHRGGGGGLRAVHCIVETPSFPFSTQTRTILEGFRKNSFSGARFSGLFGCVVTA